MDKQEFYHGAVILKLISECNIDGIKKIDGGYIVDNSAFIFIKYSTKSRTPWRFSFSNAEIKYIKSFQDRFKIFVVLICGGDGICAIKWKAADFLLGNIAGWISATRKFGQQYSVAGSKNKLKRKVSFREWPEIIKT